MTSIGGRMEVEAPRRSVGGPDYLRLAVLAAVSVAVHLWLVGHTSVTARDGVGFARFALRVQSPPAAEGPWDPTRTRLDVVRMEKHPPGYPVAVWITAKVVRNTAGLPLSESTLLAAQLVSSFAALLLVVPSYLLGRMLFGRNVGFAAALLFQVLPVPARLTSDALTEGTYLLAAVSALAIGVRAVRRPTPGWFLMCGLATGVSYLVRPEGLMVGGSVGLLVVGLGLTRRWPRDLAFGRLVAMVVGMALVAVPYVVIIGKLTNKPTGNDSLPTVPGMGRVMGLTQAPGRSTGGPVFGAFWVLPQDTGPVGIVWPAVTAAADETAKGLHYGGAALAVFGLIALRRRIVADPGVGLLVVLLGVNAAVAVALGVRGYEVNGNWVHYVSERHVILIVFLGCVFAAAGLPELQQHLRTARWVPITLLALVVATALPSTLKPLHTNREGHKHAGRWLRENLKDEDVLIDPFEWAGWYGERTLHQIPPDPKNAPVIYAVTDDKNRDEDHARLPRMREARNVAADGRSELVYHWPEDRPVSEAKVKVYRLVRPKPE